MSESRCLFLSPHLDDVVLSCALRLIKERRQGQEVKVVTIFTDAMAFLPDLYRGRKHEDQEALKILGIANPGHLRFRDAPFRNLFYTNFHSIILGQHAKDDIHIKEIVERINLIYKEYVPQTIFIPLAIGTHIDHRLTHHIWCSLPGDANIIFYEDRPYVFLPNSLPLRLTEIGASQTALHPGDNGNSLQEFSNGLRNITLYKNVLKNKKDRFHYLLWAEHLLKLASPNKKLKIEPELITTNSEEDTTQIANAIFAYKSQIELLYKNVDTFKKESAAYAHTLDASSIYAERYWKLIR